MRLSVEIQRKIIQYHTLSSNFSNRKISKMLNISHNTVGKVINLYQQCGCCYDELSGLTDIAFQEKLGSSLKTSTRSKKNEPDWDYIYGELKKRDMTLMLLWQEYRVDCPQGVSYPQFAKKYKHWKKTNRLAMRQNYKVGEQVLVDFCGRTMPIKDPSTGEIRKVQVFVGVLGASGYIFAYAVESQKINDWLQCHIEMFNHFDGVPEQVVTDNLKSAVIENTKTRLQINQSYAELAEYYNFAIYPTRPRKPRDKGLAETSVQIVQRGILAKLRHQTFFSIEELNSAIASELAGLNNKITKRFTISRFEQFLKYDKPFLTPMPKQDFSIKTRYYQKRVDEFYHVDVDSVRYSVPYQYAHKQIDIAVTDKLVEMYYQRQRIASHVKNIGKQPNVTDISHMPKDHQYQVEANPDFIKQWGSNLGDNVILWIEEFLSDKRNFALNVRKIRDFKGWITDKQFENRLDEACGLAILTNSFNLTILKNMVKSKSYLRFEPKIKKKTNNISHENVRGADYYQDLIDGGSHA